MDELTYLLVPVSCLILAGQLFSNSELLMEIKAFRENTGGYWQLFHRISQPLLCLVGVYGNYCLVRYGWVTFSYGPPPPPVGLWMWGRESVQHFKILKLKGLK